MHKSSLRDRLASAVDALMKAAIHHETASMVCDDLSSATGSCVSLLTTLAYEGERPIDAATLAPRLRHLADALDARHQAEEVQCAG